MNEINIGGKIIIQKLKKVSVFADASENSFRKITEKRLPAQKFVRGEIICSPSETDRKVIVFLSGNAAVYSPDETRNILLRTLCAGDVTGVANLFTREKYVSRIIAMSPTVIFPISEDTMKELLETDKNIMYGYIRFLSERICYLNRKITLLTAGSAERRLSYLIDSIADNETVVIPFSASATADMLNIGRASLYRAYVRLETDGFIKKDGKQITLLDRQGMLEHYR